MYKSEHQFFRGHEHLEMHRIIMQIVGGFRVFTYITDTIFIFIAVIEFYVANEEKSQPSLEH